MENICTKFYSPPRFQYRAKLEFWFQSKTDEVSNKSKFLRKCRYERNLHEFF